MATMMIPATVAIVEVNTRPGSLANHPKVLIPQACNTASATNR